MRPKICKDNGVKIPTSDCSTCDILEQKVDALTEELETKQDLLTAGDHIEIEDNVISANLDDYYDKTEIDTLIQGVPDISFEVVDELPETGGSSVIYLVPNGDTYDEYVYTDGEWVAVGSTAIEVKIRQVVIETSWTLGAVLPGYQLTTNGNLGLNSSDTITGLVTATYEDNSGTYPLDLCQYELEYNKYRFTYVNRSSSSFTPTTFKFVVSYIKG